MIDKSYLTRLVETTKIHPGVGEFLIRYPEINFASKFKYSDFIFDIWEDFVIFTNKQPAYTGIIKSAGEPFKICIKENPEYEENGQETEMSLIKQFSYSCPICRNIIKTSPLQMMNTYMESQTWCPICTKVLLKERKKEEEKDFLRINDITDDEISKMNKVVRNSEDNSIVIVKKTKEDLEKEKLLLEQEKARESIQTGGGRDRVFKDAINPNNYYDKDI